MRKLLAALLALSVLFTSVGTVSAAPTKTITIEPGQYYVIGFEPFVQATMSYHVKVISGPNVDVILTDETGYGQFKSLWSLNIRYYPEVSRLNTRDASYSSNMGAEPYYLIIDNSMAATAQPNGQSATVSVTFSTSPGPMLVLLAIIGLFLLVIILGAIIHYVRKTSKKKEDGYRRNEWICPRCSWRVLAGYTACPRCGYTIPQYAPPPSAHKIPVPPTKTTGSVTERPTADPMKIKVNGYCSKCGKPLPVGADYCMFCGAAIQREAMT